MTKKLLKIILLFLGICSLYFVPWPLLKTWIMPIGQTVDAELKDAVSKNFDAAIVCIVNQNEEVKTYAQGIQSRETKESVNPNTLFKIASCSKLYTALAITKMANDSLIDLNHTLSFYFPELKNRLKNSDKITIKMLMQHRSGLPDFTRVNNYWEHPNDNNKERLDIVLDLDVHFAPGTDYEYSNTNYLLLAEIIKKVTGNEKFKYIKENILNPLKLYNTYGSIKDVNPDRVISGYYEGYEFDLKLDDNGLMLATAEDLAKFILYLNNGKAFSSKKEEELYHSLYESNHTGLIPGYQSIARYHSDLNAAVVLFTNNTNLLGYHWNLHQIYYNRIIKILKETSEI